MRSRCGPLRSTAALYAAHGRVELLVLADLLLMRVPMVAAVVKRGVNAVVGVARCASLDAAIQGELLPELMAFTLSARVVCMDFVAVSSA